jgi:hypothetical protein
MVMKILSENMVDETSVRVLLMRPEADFDGAGKGDGKAVA